MSVALREEDDELTADFEPSAIHRREIILANRAQIDADPGLVLLENIDKNMKKMSASMRSVSSSISSLSGVVGEMRQEMKETKLALQDRDFWREVFLGTFKSKPMYLFSFCAVLWTARQMGIDSNLLFRFFGTQISAQPSSAP